MGLPKSAVSLLLREGSRRGFSGSIATLGRQHTYLTPREVDELATRHNYTLSPAEIALHRHPALAEQGFISDDSLYGRLGFESSVRIDCSSYEAPDEIVDLNELETPSHLNAAFDVVLDSGTIEHVFEVPNALRQCCQLVKPGGRIIHITPASNCVDHGFFSISPTLYADFYAASKFEINNVLLCRLPSGWERSPWEVYDYLAAGRQSLPLGRLDGRVWFTCAIVTRTPESEPAVPQQSFYVSTWSESVATDSAIEEPPDSKAARLLNAVSGSALLSRLASSLIKAWRALVNRQRERRSGRIPYPFVGRF